MKIPWSEIEELPVRFDVGSSYAEAMSSSVPSSVMCFTTDGRIVLNGVTFGGASSITINGTTYTFDSSNGNLTIPLAGADKDGMMPKEDKVKLDGIEVGAEVNVVKSVSEEDKDIHITTKDAEYKAVSASWARETDASIDGLIESDRQFEVTLNSQVNNIKEEIGTLSDELSTTKNNVATLQNSVTENYLYFSEQTTNINKQIQSIEDRYDRDHNTLTSNTERISELENYKQQTENNRSDIQAIYKKIENIDQIETNKADIQAIYQEIAKINEKISQGGGDIPQELYDLLTLDKE